MRAALARESPRCYRCPSRGGYEEHSFGSNCNFFSNNRFCATVGAQPELNTDRFAGYRKLTSASASADRNGEGVATTSEGSASRDRQNEWKRACVVAKSGSVTCCRSGGAIPGRERSGAFRNGRCLRCFIHNHCAGGLARPRRKCQWNRGVRKFSNNRHIGRFIGARNNF